MTRTLTLVNSGPFTIVQDRGRFGYEHLGIARGGALDFPAYIWANRLVGNEEDGAVLEAWHQGPAFVVGCDTWVAVTGAHGFSVDGLEYPGWTAVRMQAGSEFRVGQAIGARCYVAVAGGIDVPEVLGSLSTHVEAGFGGFQGRTLRKGDVLPIGASAGLGLGEDLVLRAPSVPPQSSSITFRCVPGPNLEHFGSHALSRLIDSSFSVSPQSNHMGIRLTGAALPHSGQGQKVSAPTTPGAIQIPPSGEPIVLLNGRGTIGGYPVLATVITPDLWQAGQTVTGTQVRFEVVTLNDALAITRSALQSLQEAKPVAQIDRWRRAT
jgi:biotin-dependent carboxylase-like uncharacterized protein